VFQKYVIGLQKVNYYLLSQIGNADKTLVYFNVPSNYTIDDTGAKSVLIKSSDSEKMLLLYCELLQC
jgi:hypothetical protein